MRPRWKLVALFYGLALGWVTLVAIGLYAAGARSFVGGTLIQFAQVTIAFLYMPAPLVAALITERVAGDGYLIRSVFAGFWRKLPRLVVSSVLISVSIVVLNTLLVFGLGNGLRVPGVGTFITTQPALVEHFSGLFGGELVRQMTASGNPVPSPWAILGLGLLGGLIAGLTINGVFGFGEEYGWRGWLMNELEPLGPVKANLLTGALWGFWHAPIIVLLGFNFEPYRYVGVLAMIVLCIPLSFLFWRSRQYVGSVWGPSVIHGMFNGSAGAFIMLVAARNPLVSASTGLVGATSIAIVAGAFWAITAGRLWSEREARRAGAQGDDATPSAEPTAA